jgi:hypothetical protein
MLPRGEKNPFFDELEQQVLIARMSARPEDNLVLILLWEQLQARPDSFDLLGMPPSAALLDLANLTVNWRQGLLERDAVVKNLRAG